VKIRVIGGGFFGSSIACGLIRDGHDVELHEIAPRLFSGASGGNPARLHLGYHYPRSERTRAACQSHTEEFMEVYGHLTRPVPVNIYAIAEHDSLIDYGTYLKVLRPELDFTVIERPADYGLCNVEGAILTKERHIVIDDARAYFEAALDGHVRFNTPPGDLDDSRWDWTVDCSGCALDSQGVNRYEPCLTVLLEGPTDHAVTIMDGGFPGIYPWNEDRRLSSLTSVRYTPLTKTCHTWGEAKAILDTVPFTYLVDCCKQMFDSMCFFWPDAADRYRIADRRLTIRAMPRSGSDARLVDVVRVGERAVRVRAGKIDAIFQAGRIISEMIR